MKKARLGFTPEEVLEGKTKHGVSFNAAGLHGKDIAVFRNRAELEAYWNNGQPTDKFSKLGDLIDPNHTMTATQSYKEQWALLAGRMQ